MDNKNKIETRDLTDRDFYQQACSYFYYHAEQRTTMINYFIAVFAAGLALYGSLIEKYPLASVLISVFLFIVSLLFHLIDLRNRFDVKQSQHVIAQFEHDYSIHTKREPDDQYLYGVFSNEDSTFNLYGFKKRWNNKEYRELRKLYKKKNKKNATKEIINKYNNDFNAFYKKNKKALSKEEIEASFESKAIITLGFSIKLLYYMCMIIAVVILGFALFVYVKMPK